MNVSMQLDGRRTGGVRRLAGFENLPFYDRPARFQLSLRRIYQSRPDLKRAICAGFIAINEVLVLFVREDDGWLVAELLAVSGEDLEPRLEWNVGSMSGAELSQVNVGVCELGHGTVPVSALCFHFQDTCFVSIIAQCDGRMQTATYMHACPQTPMVQMCVAPDGCIFLDICASDIFLYKICIMGGTLAVTALMGIEMDDLVGRLRSSLSARYAHDGTSQKRGFVVLDFISAMLPRQSSNGWPLHIRCTVKLRDPLGRNCHVFIEAHADDGAEHLQMTAWRLIRSDLAMRCQDNLQALASLLLRGACSLELSRRQDKTRNMYTAMQASESALGHARTPYYIVQ